MTTGQSLRQTDSGLLKTKQVCRRWYFKEYNLCISMPRLCQHVSNILVLHNEPSLFSVICFILLSVEYECRQSGIIQNDMHILLKLYIFVN